MLKETLLFLPVFFWLVLFIYLARIPLAVEAYRNQNKKRIIGCQVPTISVIIPARNEANNLAILLESLKEQSIKPEEIIVVDDNSEDETAEIARKAGVRVINPGPLPAGWNGKSHACFRGAEAASGDLLIFLDADTRLEKEGLEVMLNLYLDGRGLVSIQPYHRMQKAYERLSAFFNLVVFLNMNISSYISALNRPRGAFGPCILCSRSDYF
ncbi:MAG: glycosyltransferase family A protein, partial [Candidatus Saccharicenans sp.]|nr:glycosyltransferase family A protein [Candidatus Saccharicenans sp.]